MSKKLWIVLVSLCLNGLLNINSTAVAHQKKGPGIVAEKNTFIRTITLDPNQPSHVRVYVKNQIKQKNLYTKCRNSDGGYIEYCFQKGDHGDYILNISGLLNLLGYYRGKPTRLFDHEIKKSVIKYQKKHQIKPADGIVGFDVLFGLCKAHTGSGCTATPDGGWKP